MTAETATDFEKLQLQLEQQELEAAGGIASPQLYCQLLTLYLLHNDLSNAKFLWKRIPMPLKTASPEMGLIWAVGQKIWGRDTAAIYISLNKEWSEAVKPIMQALLEQTRNRAWSLVGQAYSSITAEDFSAFIGMTVPEATEAAKERGWMTDPQTQLITPKHQEKPSGLVIPNEQQLAKLTDFVCFLEN